MLFASLSDSILRRQFVHYIGADVCDKKCHTRILVLNAFRRVELSFRQ
jgi:hypothetical protein